ncbi:COX15/CtaA family protein [Xylophilus sp. ASV27]|uniref:COX15/CtaA family protein n=1 Tax=Xylophilus sp. ASV27 TaxID=2795129 RepID=UPI0018EC2999|nr:COX15/CtaA family protein [Xylophilus sp. ASV27]
MEHSDLYDLSPALQLMLTGLLVASVPLLWLWMRHRGASAVRRLQALTVLTLFLTFDLVLFGAFTRLTDSGLGCPDWPGCYGHASPVGARGQIAAAQSAMPTGPVTHGKAWVEMVHRYLATGVGVLILTLTVATWWLARQRRRRGGPVLPVHPAWPALTLVWVCIQGAFGALTVTWRLFPAIVVLHLAGGLILLALLCAQAVRHAQARGGYRPVELPPALRAGLALTCAMLALQILLGGWVSTNYAVLACEQFPTCQGSWWPPMDFAQGFQVWRPLGLLQDGSNISFAALTAIHYVHRLFAYALFLALGLLAWRLWRVPGLARAARWLAGLALWQFATGLSNVVLDWPLIAAVSHTGGAAALVLALSWAFFSSRPAAARPAAGFSGSPS